MGSVQVVAEAEARAARGRWIGAEGWGLARAVCAAFLVRAVVSLAAFHGVSAPANHFGDFGGEMGWVARSLAEGHGFSSPFAPQTGPTALVPPLFPYLLAGVFRVFGLYTHAAALAVLWLDGLFSALTCVPVYFLLKGLSGVRAARLGAWLWAGYPFAIYFSGAEVWDYSLTGLLFACCFLLAQRRVLERGRGWALLVGGIGGVTCLSNPSVVLVLGYLFAEGLWRMRRGFFQAGVLGLAGFALVTGGWMVRNYRAMHAVIPVRDGFWLEFWAGNAGDTSESNPAWAHPATNPGEMKLWEEQGEAGYLAGKRRLALERVAAHPREFVWVSARRVVRFWTGFWSWSPAYRASQPLDTPNLFFCTGVSVLMLLGLGRLWRVDRRAALKYAVLLGVFPVPYYLTHASMDYREPMEAEVVVLVALSGRRVGNQAESRRTARGEGNKAALRA